MVNFAQVALGDFPAVVSVNAALLSDAEGAEDQVKDVVGGSCAGDFVKGTEGSVEIEQEHLVGDSADYGVGRGVERGERVVD